MSPIAELPTQSTPSIPKKAIKKHLFLDPNRPVFFFFRELLAAVEPNNPVLTRPVIPLKHHPNRHGRTSRTPAEDKNLGFGHWKTANSQIRDQVAYFAANKVKTKRQEQFGHIGVHDRPLRIKTNQNKVDSWQKKKCEGFMLSVSLPQLQLISANFCCKLKLVEIIHICVGKQ